MTSRHTTDHRDRLSYRGFIEILEDLDRVLLDLARDGQLVISADDIDFTVRRSRQLVRGAMREARRAGLS